MLILASILLKRQSSDRKSHNSSKPSKTNSNSSNSESNFFNPKKFKYRDPTRQFDKNPEKDEDYEKLLQAVSNSRNGITFKPDIALLDAVNRLDAMEVEFLLSRKANPNAADDDGLTALHQACIDNAEEIVKILIKYNADVDCKDSEDWTPLHACITCGHMNIADILIKNGANLLALNADLSMPYDICDDEGPMLEFIEKNMEAQNITQDDINRIRFEPEKIILDDVNNEVKRIKSDNKDNKEIQRIVKELVDKEVCEDGGRLVHIASANGYLQLGLYLLQELNANVNVQDNDGWSAAHAACCWSQQEMLQILADFNIDFNLRTKLGEKSVDVTDEHELIVFVNKLIRVQRQKRRIKELEEAKNKQNRMANDRDNNSKDNKTLTVNNNADRGGSFTRTGGSSRRNRSVRGQALKKKGTLNASRRRRGNVQSNSVKRNASNASRNNTSKENDGSGKQNNGPNGNESSPNPDNDDMMARETEAFHEAAFWRGDIRTENDVKKHSIRKRSCRKNVSTRKQSSESQNQSNNKTSNNNQPEGSNHNSDSNSVTRNKRNSNLHNTELRTATERLGMSPQNRGNTDHDDDMRSGWVKIMAQDDR